MICCGKVLHSFVDLAKVLCSLLIVDIKIELQVVFFFLLPRRVWREILKCISDWRKLWRGYS